MTPREIILANINHDSVPRPGLTFDRGRIDDMVYGGLGPSKTYKPRRWTEGEKEYYDDEWGNIWVRMVGRSAGGEIHEPVLKDWKQLDDLRLPDWDDPERWEGTRKLFAETTDKFRLASIGYWVFCIARYLRKMEIYFMDMATCPEELNRLHKKIAVAFEAKIHRAAQCKADGIIITEDLGTQLGPLFSPAMFREYFKTEYTRLMGIAHDYGMKVLMHSCGNNRDLIDDLLDCGVDVFQFDQPAVYDMEWLAAKLRARKAALWSPVDIQKFMPTGNRDVIEREATRMVRTFRGGLIAKNYPDLAGIGVKEEWDDWAYRAVLREGGVGICE